MNDEKTGVKTIEFSSWEFENMTKNPMTNKPE